MHTPLMGEKCKNGVGGGTIFTSYVKAHFETILTLSDSGCMWAYAYMPTPSIA